MNVGFLHTNCKIDLDGWMDTHMIDGLNIDTSIAVLTHSEKNP